MLPPFPAGLTSSGAVSDREADNVERAGRYAFAYGLLGLLANVGLLGLLDIAGWPLDGVAGVLAIIRYLFDLLALATLVLAAYAFYCYRQSHGRTRLMASANILLVALVFALCGVEYGDCTKVVLSALQWLGSDTAYCVSTPLL